MEIAIIALFIVSIALIAFSYSQRDPMKDVEQELETLQLSAMQEIYKLKKKMTVLEEELLETNLSHHDVYSQGTIQPVDAAPGMLDISRLKENSGFLMDQQQIEAITQNDTVQYSEHMKGIERIYASAGRMLADISIPLTNQKECARFGLPPCVMQSVTEACALLGGKEYKTLAPVSLDELLFYESCPDKVWAEIQEKAGSFYIDLCDEEGKIWASLSGLKLQPVIKTGAPGKTNAEHRSERLYEQTLLQLKTLFALTAKIAVSNIDTEEPLETYGIDSVTVTKLNRELIRMTLWL